jgi:dephospho-CoA kinase
MFANWGVPIVDADVIARELVEPGQPALGLIAEYFGTDILDERGGLRRGVLRSRIFASDKERMKLENILHPLINNEIKVRLTNLQAIYAIIAVPLLLETGQINNFDRVLLVDCPEYSQRHRVMTRDGVDESQIDAIIASQASRQARLSVAHDVIDNSQTLDDLAAQVKSLHNSYLILATTGKSQA